MRFKFDVEYPTCRLGRSYVDTMVVNGKLGIVSLTLKSNDDYYKSDRT